MSGAGETAFGLLEEWTPSSAVTSCAAGHLVSLAESNLVVARSSVLQVYSVSRARLSLLCETRLHAPVSDLRAVPSLDPRRPDTLVLTFRDSKISTLRLDPLSSALSVASLHCRDSARDLDSDPDSDSNRGYCKTVRGPWVRADPRGRCCAVLSRDRTLVTVPFEAPEVFEGVEEAGREGRVTGVSHGVRLRAFGVDNVCDFEFLHGYSEPTVLVLYQKRLTWAGLLTVARDTASLAVLALDVDRGANNSLVWGVDNLPCGCESVVALPEPVGGALAVAPNVVTYCNYSLKVTLSLNEFGNEYLRESKVQFESSPTVAVLEAPRAVVLSPSEVLFVLSSGDSYLLTLLKEVRDVTGMVLSRLAPLAPPSCACVVPESQNSPPLVFLGCRAGSSLLLSDHVKSPEKKEPASSTVAKSDDVVMSTGEPRLVDVKPEPSEVASSSADMDTRPETARPADAVAMTDEQPQPAKPADVVCADQKLEDDIFADSTLDKVSTGPLSHTLNVEDQIEALGPIRDFAICESVDAGSNGRQVFEIVACSGGEMGGQVTCLRGAVRPAVLTAFDLPGCTGMWSLPSTAHGKLLILSRTDSTMVFAIGQSLQEITRNPEVQFETAKPTINCGVVLGGAQNVQILASAVRSFADTTISSEYPCTVDVVASAVLDPFIALVLSDGTSRVLRASDVPLAESHRLPTSNDPFVSCTLHRPSSQEVTYLLTVKASGLLEAWSLDVPGEPSRVFSSWGFKEGSHVVSDGQMPTAPISTTVVEICCLRLSTQSDSYFLLAVLSNCDLLVYRILWKPSLRFCRVDHSLITRDVGQVGTVDFRYEAPPSESLSQKVPHPRVTEWSDQSGHGLSGAFVTCGRTTVFVADDKGSCRVVPVACGHVDAIAPFSNPSCPSGIIFSSATTGTGTPQQLIGAQVMSGNLKVAAMRTELPLGTWVSRKVAIPGATPTRIAFMPDHKSCVVATTSPIPSVDYSTLIPPADADDPGPLGVEPPLPVPGYRGQFMLLSPGDWSPVGAPIDLRPHESVTCLRSLSLLETGTRASHYKNVLIAGTAIAISESITCEGRVIVLDLTMGPSGHSLSEVLSREHRAPVSAICALEGLLCAAVGSKIIVFSVAEGISELVAIAFYDAHAYTTCLESYKSFLLFGDVLKSAGLLRWVEDPRTRQLTPTSRDRHLLQVTASDLLIHGDPSVGQRFWAVVADSDLNVQVFAYDPENPESIKGQVLMPEADMHTGQRIARFVRVNCDPASPFILGSVLGPQRSMALFATASGVVGGIRLLDERAFKMFASLEDAIAEVEEAPCGTNASDSRLYRTSMHGGLTPLVIPPQKNFVNGSLGPRFAALSLAEQATVAAQVGASPDYLMANLIELTRVGISRFQ